MLLEMHSVLYLLRFDVNQHQSSANRVAWAAFVVWFFSIRETRKFRSVVDIKRCAGSQRNPWLRLNNSADNGIHEFFLLGWIAGCRERINGSGECGICEVRQVARGGLAWCSAEFWAE